MSEIERKARRGGGGREKGQPQKSWAALPKKKKKPKTQKSCHGDQTKGGKQGGKNEISLVREGTRGKGKKRREKAQGKSMY